MLLNPVCTVREPAFTNGPVKISHPAPPAPPNPAPPVLPLPPLDQTWPTAEAAVDAINDFGVDHGYAVVKARTNKSKGEQGAAPMRPGRGVQATCQ